MCDSLRDRLLLLHASRQLLADQRAPGGRVIGVIDRVASGNSVTGSGGVAALPHGVDPKLGNLTGSFLFGGLESLWSHCRAHSEDVVYYAGSSLAPATDVVVGASWKLCAREVRRGTSLCVWQVRARPYLHVPGNGFWARCDYISTLESPVHSAVRTRPCADQTSELIFPINVVRGALHLHVRSLLPLTLPSRKCPASGP
jgi:hypothetical protein